MDSGGGETGAELPSSGAFGQAERATASSLTEDKKLLTRDRIREAAMKVVAKRGFDATVADIAEVSGVSARTVFRHYGTHDRLILTTVKDMFDACGRGPVEGIPRSTEDLDGWLEGMAMAIHTRNAEIIGDAFWDIHASSHLTSETLAEVADLRREARLRGVRFLANRAWMAAGGTGESPEELVLAFALNFSAFTTQALMVDFDQSPAEIGLLTARILTTLLRRAVETAYSGGALSSGGES